MTMMLVEMTTMFDGNNEKSGTTDNIGLCAMGCCPQDWCVSGTSGQNTDLPIFVSLPVVIFSCVPL